MSFFDKSAVPPTTDNVEKKSVQELIYSMITADQLSSACATPEDEESTSGASMTNDEIGTPASSIMPTEDCSNMAQQTPNFASDSPSILDTNTISPSKKKSGSASGQSNPLLPNGKKTKGRVKIKMEFIDNKLRRYTTFSKRKTGIMKKAYELSTLTGTQVMLLVASETGHVYTFATKKLQPMITSDAGKALIQQCLNSPDSSDGPPHFGESNAMSANFHTSEIASLTPTSLLFSSGVAGGGNTTSSNQSQNRQNGNSSKRSQKLNQLQQQHCNNVIQDVLSAAVNQARTGNVNVENGSMGDLSILNDLSTPNLKGASKNSYYSASELPTMVPPNSSSRFNMDGSTASFYSQPLEPTIGDDDIELENGDLNSLSLSLNSHKDSPLVEPEVKNNDTNKMLNGSAKRRPFFQKLASSPTACTSSTPATGSTLNNILHNIVASRQQQKQQQQLASAQNAIHNSNQLAHQNRRKRPAASNSTQSVPIKQTNIFGKPSTPSIAQQGANNPSSQLGSQLGSQLFPFAGLLPGTTPMAGSTTGAQANNQAFGLFPGLSNGAFIYPPGIVYTPTPVSLPEGAAAALALQQMLATVVAANNNNCNSEGVRMGQQQSQMASMVNSSNRNVASSPAMQSSIPLSLPLSMMTANYLASQQSQRDIQAEDFDESNPIQLDEDESD